MHFNYVLFSFFINNKYKFNKYYTLNYPFKYKYNWVFNKYNFTKCFYLDWDKQEDLKFTQFYKLSYDFLYDKTDLINNVLHFKQKTGFLKKEFNFDSTVLFRLHPIKFDFNKQLFEFKEEDDFISEDEVSKNRLNNCYFNNFLKINEDADFEKNNMIYKTFDMHKKNHFLFFKNRNILRYFLKSKLNRQFKFNKFVKNLIKKPMFNFVYLFEYKLINILIKSQFFFNHRDANFFIKNNFVYVNGFVVNNPNYLIKPFDVLSLSFNKYYYFFYRKSLNDVSNTLNKISTKVWRSKNRAIKINYLNYYSNWIFNSMYFKEDVPKFLEVDYIAMTIFLLYLPINHHEFDYYNLKFLNCYLTRLYNWNYLT